jgi:predicted amidophosphoribosyltransferase
MPYCKECGSEIKDINQNYCEKCGSPIPESVKSAGGVSPAKTTSQKSTTRPGGLFDINRNYYILKERF